MRINPELVDRPLDGWKTIFTLPYSFFQAFKDALHRFDQQIGRKISMNKPKPIIKVGFCVAYDWQLLKFSLPQVYALADSICLSLDKNRRSWSGSHYDFDKDAFLKFIQSIDHQNKIDVYEDDFSLPELSSIQNDNRQRNLMAKRMGKDGWHIQIDSDEYFLDFEGFVKYLLKINKNPLQQEKPINITCNWVSVIKKTKNGFLIVDNTKNNWETMPFATNCPLYTNARRNSHFNHQSPFFVVHETWARSEEQLRQKIDSWGHDNDFVDKEAYFDFWKSLDESNYQHVENFHPLQPNVWHRLVFVEGKDSRDLIKSLSSKSYYLNPIKLFLQNSRNIHRIKKLWKNIFG
jgi:hypothetical protein